MEPIETVTARDWLAFAGIAPPLVAMIAREQQFVEKIHAYSVPRANPNGRVRDLLDLYLPVDSATLDPARCVDTVRRTFERRTTHDFPLALTPPPAEWVTPFRALTEEIEIGLECQEAFEAVRSFWTSLNVAER